MTKEVFCSHFFKTWVVDNDHMSMMRIGSDMLQNIRKKRNRFKQVGVGYENDVS